MRTLKRWWVDRWANKRMGAPDVPLRVLPWWWAVIIVVVVVAGGATAMWLLDVWGPMPLTAKDPDQLRLDRIKTALTVAAGLAAGATLLMTLRRQMLSERAQTYSERAQRFAESEALEQRTTALYVAAADQLGSDKAAVRLAGLYALERLGQDNVKLRQTVVDVWCAYLRMPYTPPAEVRRSNTGRSPQHLYAGDEEPDGVAEAEQRQELQVRLTAQRLLAAHLDPTLADVYWLDAKDNRLVLDLAGAVLVDLALRACEVGRATFAGAQFHGVADLGEAQFHGDAHLGGAQFHGIAHLGGAQFHGTADLGAQFHGVASLGGAQFYGLALLGQAQFHGDAFLNGAQFHGDSVLGGAQFHGDADLREAQFHGRTILGGAQFHGTADLGGAQFHDTANLSTVQFHGVASLGGAQFHGHADLRETQFGQGVDLSGASATLDASLPLGWAVSGDPRTSDGLHPVVRVQGEPQPADEVQDGSLVGNVDAGSEGA
ncbi:pentapeptide repeat-containing protein [Dactylosporangium sp. NPDC049140]|uniref:pentapeptide repeat-containing protein n=1 Tax=Dactylosporangium sp. NPDC049140 TaxID=3155647 RepID=UPI0033DF41EB